MPVYLQFTGSLVAVQSVQVAADSSGVVLKNHVERGQRVAKGQLLATIDTRIAGLNVEASRNAASAQVVQAEVAQLECQRAEKLLADGVISQSQYDRTQASCEASRQSAEAASAQASMASTQLAKTSVRAPFAGIVGERMVEVGAFVGPQSPVISLTGEGALRVRFAVPESLVGQVHENRPRISSRISPIQSRLRSIPWISVPAPIHINPGSQRPLIFAAPPDHRSHPLTVPTPPEQFKDPHGLSNYR